LSEVPKNSPIVKLTVFLRHETGSSEELVTELSLDDPRLRALLAGDEKPELHVALPLHLPRSVATALMELKYRIIDDEPDIKRSPGAKEEALELAGLTEKQFKFLCKPRKELDLSVRTTNMLAKSGYASSGPKYDFMWQMASEDETEILRVHNIGRKGLKEINDLLTGQDLALDMKDKIEILRRWLPTVE
jgi:hypothetical protein